MYPYAGFGLSIRSNVPIPGLAEGRSSSHGGAPLAVTLGRLPVRVPDEPGPTERLLYTSEPDESGAPALVLTEWTDRFLFRYGDGTRFVVADDGSAVWATWPPRLTVEDTATYLLGPVLAFVLRLRGRLALHAGVFTLGGCAVAVAGGPEAGKSTLLGALALRGHRVASDDVAAITEREGAFLVEPAYPRVRLWEDSVARLMGAGAELPRLTPTWDKRFLDLAAQGRFEDRALPLRALYVLDARSTAAAAPWAEPLPARAAVIAVLAQLHSVWMTPLSPQRPIFELACRLVRAVPVLRLVPHADPARLDALCALVEAPAPGAPCTD